MNWKIEIIADWDTIWSEEFQKRWLKLLDESPNGHVFFHPALIKTWVETYISLRKIKPVFILGKTEELTVLYPLVYWIQNWKNAFMRFIVPMGYSDYDYHDPVFSSQVDEDTIQSFYDQLFSLLQQKYSIDKIVLDGLHVQYIPKKFVIRLEEPCPFIQIGKFENTDSYLSSLSKDVRKSYNRRKRNLESETNLSYCVCNDSKTYEQVKYLFPKMMEYHSLRWPGAYKPPHFHEILIKRGLESQVLSFYTIQDDSNLVAAQIAFRYKEQLLLYMPTINPQYSTYSPGRLSLVYCIEDAYKKGLKVVDQLRGAELYKSEWTSDYDTIYNVEYCQNRFSYQLKKAVLSLRKIIKK